MKWFRFYSEFIDDPKVGMMSESDQLVWVKTLCLASESSTRGIIKMSDEEICWRLKLTTETWRHAKDKFRAKGMIEPCKAGLEIVNWGKRQFESDNVTARAAKSKAKSKAKTLGQTAGNVPCNVAGTLEATPPDTEQIQNTEPNPETHQDPDPERAPARRGVCGPVGVCEKEPETPEIRELPQKASASNTQNPLPKNSSVEIATIPPRICSENDLQALLNPPPDLELMERKKQALQGRLTADQRSVLIDQAIQLYNQFRGPWGECCGLSNVGRSNLERLLMVPGRSPDEFLALVQDATLFAAQSEWHNRPDFESKHFGFLIGRHQGQDRLVDYALRWRALPESSKVGAAIKITQQKDEIKYHDLQGNPTQKTWAMGIWWKISKAAIAGEAVSKLEKDWAKYYFPNYDIYVGDEWLA